MARSKTLPPVDGPKRVVSNRKIGAELDRSIRSVTEPGKWVLLREFAEFPSQARGYRTRMKNLHGDNFEFTSSIESDGVGRLYARAIPGGQK